MAGKKRSKKNLRILIAFDLGEAPAEGQDYTEHLDTKEWQEDLPYLFSMRRQGHEVRLHGMYDEFDSLIRVIREFKPHVIFNQCEAFRHDRRYEPHIVALYEMLGVRYTGPGSTALALCKDKALTKMILAHHGVPVPKFVVSHLDSPLKSLPEDSFPYPAFVKPLGLEASEGISQQSIVRNESDCLERLRFIHEKYETDAIVEEYIEGRELFVSVLGNRKLKVLPPRELFFKKDDDESRTPLVLTYKAKWDDAFRERHGVFTDPAKDLAEGVWAELERLSKKVYRLLSLNGFARFDVRMRENGELAFLEANPNPSLAIQDDFARSAQAAGLDYDDLIEKIVRLARAKRRS